MRKLIMTFTMLAFVAMGCMNAQQGQGQYMHTGTYTLQFDDNVKIKIGGAAQDQSSKQWQNGGKVGNTEISGEDFKKMQEATSSQFKFEIESKSIGTLHKIKVTDLSNGKTVNGIYDERKNEFTFGSSKSTNAGNGAGKVEIGVIKGKLDIDSSTITDGKYEVGFIAGKAPVLVSASATFTFTGSAKAAK
ncbi:MAG: hypothetical protein R2753_02310 [Chitinophagales bacterium]